MDRTNIVKLAVDAIEGKEFQEILSKDKHLIHLRQALIEANGGSSKGQLLRLSKEEMLYLTL